MGWKWKSTAAQNLKGAFTRWMGLAVFSAASAFADDYAAWAHHKEIYYNTSPDGADVARDVAAFPVLVRLDTASFPFAQARGDGRDLRFSKPDGTPVPFEIDVYDSAAHAAAIWVLADKVKGNSKGALLRLHWGNPAAPAAGDSGKVFARANGFAAVWHLRGRYPSARPNSVSPGWDAVPQNYDNDEEARGVIGYADSLDGGNPGDYLQTWDPFDSLSRGFTFSIWANPASEGSWARLMDFGNGAGKDNLVLGRIGTGDSLRFENWNGSNWSSISASRAFVVGQWQQYAVTVSGKAAHLYRNGVEIAAGTLDDTIAAVRRQNNYLGRGNWPGNQYFRGKLDEPVVSAAARGPDWIKLAYANQRPDQKLLSFIPPVVCEARFGAPADTDLPEGAKLTLSGTADCADQSEWSIVSGPSLRLLDPEAKTLSLDLPRVIADTALVLRFSARYGDSARSLDVRVAILNAVPEPRFTLVTLPTWNGRDTLSITPVIANLPSLLSSTSPELHAVWTVEGAAVDTIQGGLGLRLFGAKGKGEIKISLCLDNGGPPVCASTRTEIAQPLGLGIRNSLGIAAPSGAGYGADGRLRNDARGLVPRFTRPEALNLFRK